MNNDVPHLVVCICTFRRPLMLERLLGELDQQLTGDAFTFSAVVADNDASQSARSVTEKFAKESAIALTYCVQPKRNIALARNTAVSYACGEFVIFIDDDEFPAKEWLFNLFKTCQRHGVAGVLGPVLPHFDEEPPKWLRAGGFYERPRHPTGFRLEWPECRTGNVLLRKRVLEDLDGPFAWSSRAVVKIRISSVARLSVAMHSSGVTKPSSMKWCRLLVGSGVS